MTAFHEEEHGRFAFHQPMGHFAPSGGVYQCPNIVRPKLAGPHRRRVCTARGRHHKPGQRRNGGRCPGGLLGLLRRQVHQAHLEIDRPVRVFCQPLRCGDHLFMFRGKRTAMEDDELVRIGREPFSARTGIRARRRPLRGLRRRERQPAEPTTRRRPPASGQDVLPHFLSLFWLRQMRQRRRRNIPAFDARPFPLHLQPIAGGVLNNCDLDRMFPFSQELIVICRIPAQRLLILPLRPIKVKRRVIVSFGQNGAKNRDLRAPERLRLTLGWQVILKKEAIFARNRKRATTRVKSCCTSIPHRDHTTATSSMHAAVVSSDLCHRTWVDSLQTLDFDRPQRQD